MERRYYYDKLAANTYLFHKSVLGIEDVVGIILDIRSPQPVGQMNKPTEN